MSTELTPRVTIYGSMSCSHCVEFKSELDRLDVGYIFNDVEFSDELTMEMLQVVQDAGLSGPINYPVIVIDKAQVLIRPELQMVINTLK